MGLSKGGPYLLYKDLQGEPLSCRWFIELLQWGHKDSELAGPYYWVAVKKLIRITLIQNSYYLLYIHIILW